MVRYAAGAGERPGRAEARRVLDELVANTAAERCTRRPEVIAALFRRAPVTLPAYAFTFRGHGRSYATRGARPHDGLRPDDAVTLRRRDRLPDLDFSYAPDADPGTTIVADLSAGEWLAFDVELGVGPWRLTAVTEGGRPTITVEGVGAPVANPVGIDGVATAWVTGHHAARAGRVTLVVRADDAPLTLLRVAIEAGP